MTNTESSVSLRRSYSALALALGFGSVDEVDGQVFIPRVGSSAAAVFTCYDPRGGRPLEVRVSVGELVDDGSGEDRVEFAEESVEDLFSPSLDELRTALRAARLAVS